MNLTKVIRIIIVILFVLIVLAITIRQPWQKKKIILSINIPNSTDIIELWEKPYCYYLGNEYETWFVVKPSSEESKWYVIDKQYITFRKITVLISSDNKYIRIETDGKSTPSHMIAEYNLNNKIFKAESAETVKNKEGWIMLKEQVVR